MAKKESITKPREPLGILRHEIGRRDFLIRTVYGCAALGMGKLLTGCSGDDAGFSENDNPSSFESRTYYFDLSAFDPEDEFYISMPHGNAKILPMDTQARESLADSCSVFAAVPEGRVTHYGQFEMPSNSVKLCYVYGIGRRRSLNYMTLAFFHFPSSAMNAANATAAINADSGDEIPDYNKLRFLGVSPSQIRAAASRRSYPSASNSNTSPAPPTDDCTDLTLICAFDLACTMAGMHLEALSLEPASALNIRTHIESVPSTSSLAMAIHDLMIHPEVLSDGSINLGWAIQYPIPVPGKPGQYRTYTSSKSPRKGQKIYTVAWSQEENLTGPLNETIEATLQYVKENLYINTTDISQPDSELQGKLAQVRDGTPYVVAPSSSTQLANPDAFANENTGLNYAFKDISNETGMKLELKKVEGNNLTFGISNWYVRFLGLGIQYLDSGGQPIKISALSPDTQTWADASLYSLLNNDDTIMTHLASPESTLYGIPIESYEGELVVPYDPAASGIRVLAGGLGSHGNIYDQPTDLGMGFTIAFNLALPTIFLISDAAITYAAASKAITEDEKALAEVAKFLIGELIDIIKGILLGKINFKDMGIEAAKFIFALAAKPAFAWLWGEIVATLGAGAAADAAEEATPIVGWILFAMEIAGLVATIAETIAEVIRSPFTYVSELTFTHDITVEVHPSNCPAEDQTFPADLWDGAGGSYVIKLSFDKSSAHSSESLLISSLSSTPTSDPISFTFKGVPYGGNVSVSIGMYTSDNFLAAACATGYMPNQGGSATQDSSGALSSGCSDPGPSPDTSNIIDNMGNLTVTMHVNEKKIPLTASTQYDFLQKTSLDADGNHIWVGTDAPSETAESLVSEPVPGYMEAVYDITVNEIYQSVGYGWRSTSDDLSPHTMVGLFANLSITDDPESSYLLGKKSDSEGFSGALPLYISYDLMNKNNHNFFIDTSDGKNRVRQIIFSDPSSPPSFSQGKSFGRFSLPSNAFVVHPKSIIYSVNREYNKIEKIDFSKYNNLPVDDADAPVAESVSGKGTREGLISGPVCMAVSADGIILVLEADNGKIQAFDAGLSPVKHFSKGTYSFALKDGDDSSYKYVGMAVEFTGYIYVLSYKMDTYAYRLDIYKPDGTFLTRTEGVNAGGIAVDFWRTVYTLNYEVLKKPDGDLPGVTEPSMSMWTPST